jgi:hypothetical protein
MLIAHDIASALDPVAFARQCGIEPDAWQRDFLRSPSRRVLQLAARQVGKTLSCAIKAFHIASYEPEETTVIVAPSERQSKEFVRAMMQLHRAHPEPLATIGESVTKVEFVNGSRVVALPGGDDGRGIRGIPKVRLLLVDEGAQCSDDLLAATTPMLATHPRAELIALSTPKGRRGWFWDAWENGGDIWSRVRVTTDMCPRITPEFLTEQRQILGPTRFAEEFDLQFLDADAAQAFPSEIIDGIFSNDVRPLWC